MTRGAITVIPPTPGNAPGQDDTCQTGKLRLANRPPPAISGGNDQRAESESQNQSRRGSIFSKKGLPALTASVNQDYLQGSQQHAKGSPANRPITSLDLCLYLGKQDEYRHYNRRAGNAATGCRTMKKKTKTTTNHSAKAFEQTVTTHGTKRMYGATGQ